MPKYRPAANHGKYNDTYRDYNSEKKIEAWLKAYLETKPKGFWRKLYDKFNK